MAQPATDPRIVQFGLFELDLDARELRKSGLRIKLQEQPFQILAMLLERPGEIVTRDELQKRLWGPGHICRFRSQPEQRSQETATGAGRRF